MTFESISTFGYIELSSNIAQGYKKVASNYIRVILYSNFDNCSSNHRMLGLIVYVVNFFFLNNISVILLLLNEILLHLIFHICSKLQNTFLEDHKCYR